MNALINLDECKEYIIIQINEKNYKIKLAGTLEDPYFCGKDIACVLGYQQINFKKILQKFVDNDDKTLLSNLKTKDALCSPNILGDSLNVNKNEGRAVYINEAGLYSLIMASEAQFAKEFKKIVCKIILPSIRKYGSYHIEQKLSDAIEKLSIKDKELEEYQIKLRSETKKFQDQVKKALEFSQATKKIDPKEYIYICTTEYYQTQNKFKVGGVQSFQLLKSRLTQYNSGESENNLHFYVYIKKTVSYKAIEHAIKGMLIGFRENPQNEMYILHYDWLITFVDSFIDGGTETTNLINLNRDRAVQDTIFKAPTIVAPLRLEQFVYFKAGDEPKDLTNVLNQDIIDKIREALEVFEPQNNIIRRKEFEKHFEYLNPTLCIQGKKRSLWEVIRSLGTNKNPKWQYKY